MAQSKRKNKKKSPFLSEKKRIFEKYADHMPLVPDKVDFQLKYEHISWVDIYILVNGEEKAFITASYAYEPFEDIKEWLENIVKHLFDKTPWGVNIYDETNDNLLYYMPIPNSPNEQITETPFGLCGIFYYYDGYEEKIVADAVCDTEAFVKNIYKSILSFAKEMKNNDEFVEEWVESVYNKEYGEMEDGDPRIKDIFISKVTSELLDKFLDNA